MQNAKKLLHLVPMVKSICLQFPTLRGLCGARKRMNARDEIRQNHRLSARLASSCCARLGWLWGWPMAGHVSYTYNLINFKIKPSISGEAGSFNEYFCVFCLQLLKHKKYMYFRNQATQCPLKKHTHTQVLHSLPVFSVAGRMHCP